MDQRTGTQLSFENVLILQTLVYPRENNYLMDVELSGGMGYYVSNGGIEQLTWEKSSESAAINRSHTLKFKNAPPRFEGEHFALFQ